MPTIYKEGSKEVVNTCADPEVEVDGLLVDQLGVEAGFVLADPQDPRYQQVARLRTRFGNLVHHAATKLRQSQDEEDHIDAVIAVVKAIDTFFLDYGMSRGDFTTLQKNFVQSRECVLFCQCFGVTFVEMPCSQSESHLHPSERQYARCLGEASTVVPLRASVYALAV